MAQPHRRTQSHRKYSTEASSTLGWAVLCVVLCVTVSQSRFTSLVFRSSRFSLFTSSFCSILFQYHMTVRSPLLSCPYPHPSIPSSFPLAWIRFKGRVEEMARASEGWAILFLPSLLLFFWTTALSLHCVVLFSVLVLNLADGFCRDLRRHWYPMQPRNDAWPKRSMSIFYSPSVACGV